MPVDALSVCRDAIALARLQRDGRAWAILAWRENLPADPVATFAAATGRRTLLWRDDGWLLGMGEAFTVTADGPGRASHLATAVARLEARCAIGVSGESPKAPSDAPALPALLTAWAFEDQAPAQGGAWGHLPGARLWLPRQMRWLRDGAGWAIAALAVGAGDDPYVAAEALLKPAEPMTTIAPSPWPTLHDGYQDQVEDAVALIREGALRKLVLARAVDQDLAGTTASTVLARLRRHAAGAVVFAHDLDDGALFIGATPELLFAASGNQVSTMALAGSAARPSGTSHGDEIADEAAVAALMASTKERKEHGIVVEHLTQVLRPRAKPFAVPGGPHARLLSRLIHLETNLAAELRQADYFELLGALHPTPAVCGLPTPMARSYLARHEHLQRGLYSGALGWSTPADCRFVVPLRGAIMRAASGGGSARLFAGAGIVETSVPVQEWRETEMKLDVFRAALGNGVHGEAKAGP